MAGVLDQPQVVRVQRLLPLVAAAMARVQHQVDAGIQEIDDRPVIRRRVARLAGGVAVVPLFDGPALRQRLASSSIAQRASIQPLLQIMAARPCDGEAATRFS